LPTQSIYDLFQDSKGLIWLGTDNGLIRFDGRTFKKFPAAIEFRKSITNILEDENGIIYCQNFAGQVFKTTNSADSIYHIEKIQGLGRFSEIAMIDGHLLAFNGVKKVCFFDTKNQEIIETNIPSQDYHISFFSRNTDDLSLLSIKHKDFLILDGQGIRLNKSFTSNASVLFHANLPEKDYIVNRLYPFDITEVQSGKKIDLACLSPEVIINHISLIDEDKIGFFTTSGVLIFDMDFKLKWKWFQDESVSGGFKDHQNNYWFSTLQNGLILVTQPNVNITLENHHLTCITSDGSNIYVGTADNEIIKTKNGIDEEVIFKDATNHPMRHIYYNRNNKDLLFSNQFFNVLSDGTLSSKKISVNHISPISSESYLLAESATVSILIDKKDESNIEHFEKKYSKKEDRLILSNEIIRAEDAVQIAQNNFLVSTTDGILEITPEQTKEILFHGKKIYSTGLSKKNEDTTLIATIVDGILLYTSNQISPYLFQKEIQQKPIKKLLNTKELLFILYTNALDVFDSNKRRIKTFSAADGLSSINFNDLLITNDSVKIASDKGLISFALQEIMPNNEPPKIQIISTKINQKIIDTELPFQLKSHQNVIEIEFAILDYKGLETTSAYYCLNEGEWIKATGNKITLTSLAAGEYRVRLKAVNERGIASLNPIELNFKIPSPWYWSWWFLLIIGLLLVGTLSWFFKRRLRREQKTNTLLNEKIQLEKALHQSTLTSIKAQMNPHFIFNALNTIQSYIYTNDKHSASSYLVDFSELTRLILAMSNQESVSLHDEIKMNSLYLKLEKMRFEDDFDYSIVYSDLETDTIRVPPMLIQPYIENAIKHGLLHKKNEKKLTVSFSILDEVLHVDIIDNGIGIEASSKINSQRQKNHQSFALQANKKRLEILNSGLEMQIGEEIISLFDSHGYAAGTHVKLKIPITSNKHRLS
jgi:hypothetical protein